MEQKKKRPVVTMRDVAKLAGVSTATVSRTLITPEKVSPHTRKKVEKAALAIGYSSNILLRSIKKMKSNTILVLVPDIHDPFYMEIIEGIEDVAAEQNYLILLGNCAQKNISKILANYLTTKQVDGIILLSPCFPFDISTKDRKNLPPMVRANSFASKFKIPTVHIDNLTAAYDAVNYLYQLGHQRIACICGPQNYSLGQYRRQGSIHALQRSGIAIEENYFMYGDFSYVSGKNAMHTLMELPQPPTAIFCHSDTMAIGALAQAKQLKLRIPEDISIIGFDNIELTKYTDPPLTTVAQPCYQIGQQVMLLLLQQLQGLPIKNSSLLLDSKLIIRGSTAAPTA